MVTKSELNAINRVEAINTLAISVVAYILTLLIGNVDCKRSETRQKSKKITHLTKDAPPRKEEFNRNLPRRQLQKV